MRLLDEHNTKFSFFILNLIRYSPFGFNPKRDCQHLANLVKLNAIDEVWKSTNSLFKWIFGSLSSRNFATMATWRKDFSSPLQKKKKENIHRHVFQKLACSRQPLAYQSQTKDRRTKRIFRFLCFFVGLDAVTSYNISYLMAKREWGSWGQRTNFIFSSPIWLLDGVNL